MKYSLTKPLIISTLIVLVACGGGSSTSTNSKQVTITANNYTDVASGSVNTLDLATSSTNTLPGAVTAIGVQISYKQKINLKKSAFIIAQYISNNRQSFNNDTIIGASIDIPSENCADGGTRSGSFNDADGSTNLSSGDSATVKYTNCKIGNDTSNGTVTITFTQYIGDPFDDANPQGSIKLTANFINYVSNSTDTLNGNFTIEQADATTENFKLIFPSFKYTSNSDKYEFTNLALSFSSSNNINSFTMDGTIDSSSMGGSVVISSPTPLTSDASNNMTGTLVITGANNTKVRLTGQGTSNILVEADTNGDGIYDINKTLSESELFGVM